MKKPQIIYFCVALILIGGAAYGMRQLKIHQRLGLPGIKTTPIANSPRLNIYLPEQVLDYNSTVVPTDSNVLIGLPQDTSFMQRRYTSPTGPALLLNVVLMGTDRTSIHKPQFCLVGAGWNIDGGLSVPDTLHIESPKPYDLPVMKLLMTREVNFTNKNLTVTKLRGFYVYWFVAEHELTSSHWTRMEKSATHLLATGELERWAYIGCLGVCLPGQEEQEYEKIKQFIIAAVPQFQLATGRAEDGPSPPKLSRK